LTAITSFVPLTKAKSITKLRNWSRDLPAEQSSVSKDSKLEPMSTQPQIPIGYRQPMPLAEEDQFHLGNSAEEAAGLMREEREWDWKWPLLLVVAAVGAGYGAWQAGVKLAGMWAP
jgi:hypothetical protein